MEIIFKTNASKSNFEYCSEIFNSKEKMNGFNKVPELMCEIINDTEFHCGNVKFEENINGTLYLCYPLSVVVKDDINFSSLHELIKEIRKTYKKIYKDPIKYGIWGHDIYDLCIESITVYKDGSVNVSIGS